MGTVLYFDPFNGISGDMILGALIHLGLPLDHLEKELAKLDLKGYQLVAREVDRQGLRGVDLQVEQQEVPHDGSHHDHHTHGNRHFTEIKHLIEESDLPSWVQKTAVSIFQRLGEAGGHK